jgi:hypothetical protein
MSPFCRRRMAGFCFVDMETLIWQLVDRWMHTDCAPYRRPDLITRVSDLVIVSGTCALASPPRDRGEEWVEVSPGRYPVYVGTYEPADWYRPPEAAPDWQVASMLFVPLAEPERIADARPGDGAGEDVGLPVEGYVTLNDPKAWRQAPRLPNDPVQGQPTQVFLRDVEDSVKAGHLGAPSTWPSLVVDDESGWNVLALPIGGEFVHIIHWEDDEELVALMYLTYQY